MIVMAALDDAWVEAAVLLPDGWRLSVAEHPEDYAAFATPPAFLPDGTGALVGTANTPAGALRALSRVLRERAER